MVVTQRAQKDLNDARDYIARHAPETAERWYVDFLRALLKLGDNPRAYSVADESQEFPFELRQYLYRTRSGRANRVLYTILEDQVRVLAIRRPGQDLAKPEDLR